MKTRSKYNFLLVPALIGCLVFISCSEEPQPVEETSKIIYKVDGRSVKVSDVSPIAVDLSEDGIVDFTVFVQLSANGQGDHLNVGINPIGFNLIKSGPSNDSRFLNMGFAIEEPINSLIDGNLGVGQRWTSDHSALVIRHTNTNGSIWYEGPWQHQEFQIVAIRHERKGNLYFGWLRLTFNKVNETVTLIDYAYREIPNKALRPDESIFE